MQLLHFLLTGKRFYVLCCLSMLCRSLEHLISLFGSLFLLFTSFAPGVFGWFGEVGCFVCFRFVFFSVHWPYYYGSLLLHFLTAIVMAQHRIQLGLPRRKILNPDCKAYSLRWPATLHFWNLSSEQSFVFFVDLWIARIDCWVH